MPTNYCIFFDNNFAKACCSMCMCVCDRSHVPQLFFTSYSRCLLCFFFVSSLGDFRLAGFICSSEYLIKSLWCMANICHNNFNFCFILPGANGRMMCELMNSINCYLRFIYYLANLVIRICAPKYVTSFCFISYSQKFPR